MTNAPVVMVVYCKARIYAVAGTYCSQIHCKRVAKDIVVIAVYRKAGRCRCQRSKGSCHCNWSIIGAVELTGLQEEVSVHDVMPHLSVSVVNKHRTVHC